LCRTVKGERVHEDAGDQDDPRLDDEGPVQLVVNLTTRTRRAYPANTDGFLLFVVASFAFSCDSSHTARPNWRPG